MDDRENTDPNNQEAKGNPMEPFGRAPTPSTSNAENPHSENIHRGSQDEPATSDHWFQQADWWMVILTALTVVVAAVTLRVFWKQFQEMQTQTGILNAQAQQAASDSIEAARKVEEQISIARDRATAAQDSVKAIQRQMRLDQRPWIKLSYVIKPFDANVGDTIKATISMEETGKTAALKIDGEWIIAKVKQGSKLNFPYTHIPKTAVRAGVMYPGEPAVSREIGWLKSDPKDERFSLPRTLTVEDVVEVSTGSAYFIVYGRVRYLDGFNIRHWTHFCSAVTAIVGNYRDPTCASYNGVDKNY